MFTRSSGLAAPQFDGADYKPKLDHARLTGQIERVFAAIKDGQWRTLAEIAARSNAPEASVSAQLRNLRKERFGSHSIDRQRRTPSLWEYRLGEPT